jgi:hypothetical protein
MSKFSVYTDNREDGSLHHHAYMDELSLTG